MLVSRVGTGLGDVRDVNDVNSRSGTTVVVVSADGVCEGMVANLGTQKTRLGQKHFRPRWTALDIVDLPGGAML